MMLPRARHAAHAAVAIALLASTCVARAVPPTREEIAQWCNDAEDSVQCGRLIEAKQMQRLPGLAARDGATLKVALFPSGSHAFTDTEDVHGGTAYNLWDNWSEINAVVISVSREDRTTYQVLMRGNGRTFDLPAEPVLAPDRKHLVTADFCPRDCSNEIVVWKVTRDDIARQSSWTPSPAWSDAAIAWKGPDALAIDYTPMGATDSRRLERRLDDPSWRAAPR
jgi:hypothetical protein